MRLDCLRGEAAIPALSAFGTGTPFQARGFVGAFAATRGRAMRRETVVLVGSDAGGPVLAIPLEIRRRGPFRIASFPGETHANANGPLRPSGATGAHRLTPEEIAVAARDAGLRIDAVDLRRVPEPCFLDGATVVPAAETRFSVTLGGGFEAVLAKGNAKRKRKKFRAQQRHFEAQGGYVFRDVPHAERPAALAAFLSQKRERFRRLRMPNPFSDIAIDAFLRALFEDSAADARLYTVESGGTIKAMMGGLAADGTFWGMFSSFADDGDATASPGELLLWHLVERLCAEGFAELDLGPGEERYKLSWCDRTTPQYDLLAPLGARGRLYVAAALASRRAIVQVKSEPRLKAAAQRLRRLLRRE